MDGWGGKTTLHFYIVQTWYKTSRTTSTVHTGLPSVCQGCEWWIVNTVIVLLRVFTIKWTRPVSLLSSHYDTLFILFSSQSQPSDVRPIMEAMEDVNKQWEADTVTTIEASFLPRPWLQNISSFSYHQGMSKEGGPGCVRINLWVKALNIVMKASN